MSQIVTDAIVLHAFDYLESSRILKLVTRDGGVRSVLARGARRSRSRFGAALDLYSQGSAELHTKPGRELDTLAGFDVTRARHTLAADLGRFTGASMLAELTLRFARDAADPGLFAAVEDAFDDLGVAPSARTRDVALGGAWRVLAELGIAPTIDVCAECHNDVAADAQATFNHRAGGVLCERCTPFARTGRVLPAAARDALRTWLDGQSYAIDDPSEIRAHQRLLREFLREHLGDDRSLTAFTVWEQGTLETSSPATVRP